MSRPVEQQERARSDDHVAPPVGLARLEHLAVAGEHLAHRLRVAEDDEDVGAGEAGNAEEAREADREDVTVAPRAPLEEVDRTPPPVNQLRDRRPRQPGRQPARHRALHETGGGWFHGSPPLALGHSPGATRRVGIPAHHEPARCPFVTDEIAMPKRTASSMSSPSGADAHLLKDVIHDWDDARAAATGPRCTRRPGCYSSKGSRSEREHQPA